MTQILVLFFQIKEIHFSIIKHDFKAFNPTMAKGNEADSAFPVSSVLKLISFERLMLQT